MLEAFHHPIEIMCFGFELTDGVGGIGGDEYFLSGLRQHADLDLPECVGRDVLFETVHQLEVFVGDVEDRSPDLFAWLRGDAGETASPLRGPSAEFDRVLRKRGPHQELMLRSATFQLCGVKMVPVEKELHQCFTPKGTCLLTSRMLKKSSNVVLGSFRPSTGTRPPHHSAERTDVVLLIAPCAPEGTPPVLTRLRPRLMSF